MADMMVEPRTLSCPWCGAPTTVMFDLSSQEGEFVEDCQVCCAPILYSIRYEIDTEYLLLSARRENE